MEEKLEKKLDELIELIKLQNTAWEHCLNMLNGIATMMNEKNNAEAQLLKEHPAVRQPTETPGNTAPTPAPVGVTPPTESPTVGNQRQPNPFNTYTDAVQYGAEIEQERVSNSQSFPPSDPNDFRQAAQQLQQPAASPPQSAPPPPPQQQAPMPADAGESVVSLDSDNNQNTSVSPVQGPPTTSKAELLERQGG